MFARPFAQSNLRLGLTKLFTPELSSKRPISGVAIDHQSLPEHKSLMIERYGQPEDSVFLKIRRPEEILPKELSDNQVLVEHLAACINPNDINTAQGVYPVKSGLPAIIGNEGALRVKAVGPQVKHLKTGDLVLGLSMNNYWQTYSIQDAQDMYKLKNDLDPSIAAQLRVNPCTAYRMIKDFGPHVNLKPGDTIIQNGANSAVGVYAIQLAKHWGLRTINVIRDRSNRDEVVQELKNYGADIVLTEEEVSDINVISPILKNLGKPKLFLNCVGGKNENNCRRILDQPGYSVVYGGMSKQPLTVGISSLIFKDHKLSGFWMTRWYSVKERSEISSMLDEVCDMFKNGILRSKSTTEIDFEDRNIAFSGTKNNKYIFAINKR